jgi:hypothetical protein
MVNFFANHRNRKDNCPYAKPRKTYIRNKPYPTHTIHIKPQLREKCAVVKLTKLGYSTNQLAQALGRSTSYIHRIVRTAITRGLTHFIDKRKLPNQTRLRCSSIRRKTLIKYLPGWEAFILGEGDKPP